MEQWQQEARGCIRGEPVGGSGTSWVRVKVGWDDPGSRIESNREKGPKREGRPALLRHAKKIKDPVGFYLGGPMR